MIRPRGFRGQGQLGTLPGFQVASCPAALPGHPTLPLLLRSIDEHETVANLVPAGFQHHGRIEHDELHGRVETSLLHFAAYAFPDPGVHHRLQGLTLAWIGEHDRCQLAATHLAILVEYLSAPA